MREYFSHDYDCRSDEKIELLIMKHGMEGYGIYWAIVENLYKNANALQPHYERIAFALHSQCEVVKSVINDFGLFFFDGEIFGSHSVQRRLDERNSKSIKAKESAIKRWGDANALRTQSDRNAIKEKKRKEKYIPPKGGVGDTEKAFTPPMLEEVKKYFQEKGYRDDVAEKAWESYEVADWHDSQGKKIKNWKQKMIQVWFQDNHKIRAQPIEEILTEAQRKAIKAARAV